MTLVCLLILGCTSDNQEIQLQLKYKPGMVLSYVQESRGQVNIYKTSSENIDSLVEVKPYLRWAEVEHTVDRQLDDSTYDIIEKVMWYHTKPNEDDSSIVDTVSEPRQMTLTVLTNGKIVDFSVSEKNRSKVSYLKNYYEQGIPVFPEDPVNVGYTWNQTTKVVLPDEPMEASTSYTVKSLVRELGYDCALITYNGNLLIPIDAVEKEYKRTGLEKITVTGSIYFAYKKGLVVKQNETWQMNRDVTSIQQEKTEQYKVQSDIRTDFRLISAEGI